MNGNKLQPQGVCRPSFLKELLIRQYQRDDYFLLTKVKQIPFIKAFLNIYFQYFDM